MGFSSLSFTANLMPHPTFGRTLLALPATARTRSEPDWHTGSIYLEHPIAQRINAGSYLSIVSRLLRKNS